MIDAKIIDLTVRKLGIRDRDIIEKDIILQMLLHELSKNKEFSENFAFKGGTCLTKCYLGSYRFSEDLDFTYINKKAVEGSKKGIRRALSNNINKLALIIDDIAKKLNLDFKVNKTDRKYFEFGGSNAFITLKLWYSKAAGGESFIKIQANFIEKLEYPVKTMQAEFLLNKERKEIESVLPEYSYLLEPMRIKVYDIREILLEKIRAILTRRGVKARDFIDVFLILEKEKLELKDFRKEIMDKIKIALKFDKYSKNIANKSAQFKEKLILEAEERLLISKIPGGFDAFLKDFRSFLEELLKELNSSPLL